MALSIPVPHLVLRDFLSAEEAGALLRWTLANETRFSPGKVADGLNRDIKRCEKLNDLGPSKAVFEERIRAGYADWLQRMRMTPFSLGPIELQLAAYADQAHFNYHTDSSPASAEYAGRSLTAIYYFYSEPKGFSGGALRLYNVGAGPGSSDYKALEPRQNTLVVFPSWAGHEVATIACPTNAFADSRFTVNCWLNKA